MPTLLEHLPRLPFLNPKTRVRHSSIPNTMGIGVYLPITHMKMRPVSTIHIRLLHLVCRPGDSHLATTLPRLKVIDLLWNHYCRITVYHTRLQKSVQGIRQEWIHTSCHLYIRPPLQGPLPPCVPPSSTTTPHLNSDLSTKWSSMRTTTTAHLVPEPPSPLRHLGDCWNNNDLLCNKGHLVIRPKSVRQGITNPLDHPSRGPRISSDKGQGSGGTNMKIGPVSPLDLLIDDQATLPRIIESMIRGPPSNVTSDIGSTPKLL